MRERVEPHSLKETRLYSTFILFENGRLCNTGNQYNSLTSCLSNKGFKNWIVVRIQPTIKYLYKWDINAWQKLDKKEVKCLKQHLTLNGKVERVGDKILSKTNEEKTVNMFSRTVILPKTTHSKKAK